MFAVDFNSLETFSLFFFFFLALRVLSVNNWHWRHLPIREKGDGNAISLLLFVCLFVCLFRVIGTIML